MVIIDHIEDSRWEKLIAFVDAELAIAKTSGVAQAELSYDTVKEALGYYAEVDFYQALWTKFSDAESRPNFWYHGNHRPSALPKSFVFYYKKRGTDKAVV